MMVWLSQRRNCFIFKIMKIFHFTWEANVKSLFKLNTEFKSQWLYKIFYWSHIQCILDIYTNCISSIVLCELEAYKINKQMPDMNCTNCDSPLSWLPVLILILTNVFKTSPALLKIKLSITILIINLQIFYLMHIFIIHTITIATSQQFLVVSVYKTIP